jgi:hypothetical protein
VIPDSVPHEARERDYFFVLGFWAWGCFAGYGALAIARARRWPPPVALLAALVPLLGNWGVSDRAAEPRASAARVVARVLLLSAPPHALLFTAGDNDSYPLWYAQQVEGMRPDVSVVTLSLLPAGWYQDEIARRTGLRWSNDEPVAGALLEHEQIAGLVAKAARGQGRPVAASTGVTARERAVLGSDWRLEGPLYASGGPADGRVTPARIDTARALRWASRLPIAAASTPPLVDDVAADMLALLSCHRLALPPAGSPAGRDSLEVKCNLR